VAEAWGRPLLAVALVMYVGPHAWVVLSGYLFASMVNCLLFGCVPMFSAQRRRNTEEILSPETLQALRKYSQPLMPLGLVGWVSNLSDRYLIGGILGMHQAGIYSAIYGLVSRPFLMAQGTLELTLRPVYFEAVVAGNRRREWHLYRRWFALNALAGVLLVAVFMGGGEVIVENLLGKEYRGSVVLIPYIALGHMLLIMAYNFNSYLYAHQYTRQILILGTIGAMISVVVVALCASVWGLIGAAASCVVYFASQAGILAWFIWKKERHETL